MPATSAPTWAVAAAAGQAPSIVRLRNLQSTARIGLDAWSRTSRPQPLLVSASVSLVQSSASSSASDSVAADTVHYGLLSKAILSTLNGVEGGIAAGAQTPVSLRNLLDLLWETLTGKLVNGTPAKATSAPFLDLRSVRCLSLKLQLPKASLVGGCVSLTGTSVYNDGEAQLYGVCLGLSNLRVPTLIGVNSNEREAKQVVIADVEIDECCEEGDIYPHLENVIYESMAGSDYATLETLATSMAESIRTGREGTPGGVVEQSNKWHIKIKLEKPIAVPLAEGAGIEFLSPALTNT